MAKNMTKRNVAGKQLSLRERNKLDKLRRIRAAAHKLFSQQGYDKTTTKEIAETADVGMGTLWAYASDKLDLLFLVYINLIEDVIAPSSFAGLPKESGLVAKLTHSFRNLYVFWSKDPSLARVVFKNMEFYQSGKNVAKFQSSREQFKSQINELVAEAQRNGEVRSNVSAPMVGNAIFALYSAQVRQWLDNEASQAEEGVQELQQMLQLLFEGLRPDSTS
jgi:AcrR family transcriptional regulator